MNANEDRIDKLEHAIFGNGKRGLVRDMDALCAKLEVFMAKVETRADERAELGRITTSKINTLLTLGLMIFAAISAFTAYMVYRDVQLHQSVFPVHKRSAVPADGSSSQGTIYAPQFEYTIMKR